MLRRLILLDILVVVLGILLVFADGYFLPPELADYTGEDKALSTLELVGLLVILIVVIGLGVLSWVALWRGWASGRFLYTLAMVVGFVFLILHHEPVVESGPGAVLNTVTGLISGAILCLIYFTDLRHRFTRHESRPTA